MDLYIDGIELRMRQPKDMPNVEMVSIPHTAHAQGENKQKEKKSSRVEGCPMDIRIHGAFGLEYNA